MDVSILTAELNKARKRLKEQSDVVDSTKAVIASDFALPALKAIASRRLPKLNQVLQETNAVIHELEVALRTGSQPDLLDTASAPSKKR